jgi:putative phosphoesterase
VRVGVVSDTHGFFDPRLKDLLAGVDIILHGGDVGSEEVLDELKRIAPVRAVRGNVDSPDLELPLSLKLSLESLQVEIMHVLPVPQSELEEWLDAMLPGGRPPKRSEKFLATFDEATGVVVFGHTHQPCLTTLGDRLFFNPGSAGKKRFDLPRCCGLLEVVPGRVRTSRDGSVQTRPSRIRASIELLEKYHGVLPPRIEMDIDTGGLP